MIYWGRYQNGWDPQDKRKFKLARVITIPQTSEETVRKASEKTLQTQNKLNKE